MPPYGVCRMASQSRLRISTESQTSGSAEPRTGDDGMSLRHHVSVSTGSTDVFGLGDTFLAWVSPQAGLSGNLAPGTALFVAGVTGSLITMYLTDPERLPQFGGASRLSRMRQELDRARSAWLDEASRAHSFRQGASSAATTRRLTDLRDCFTALQRDFRSERRIALVRGIPLFVILAGTLALFLGRNLLEAVAVGAAWPAFLQGLGLQRENQALKDEAAELSTAEITRLGEELQEARQERDDAVEIVHCLRDALAQRTGQQQNATANPSTDSARGEGDNQ